MKRRLIVAIITLPLLGLLAGCVVVPDDDGWHHHHHEWREHDRW